MDNHPEPSPASPLDATRPRRSGRAVKHKVEEPTEPPNKRRKIVPKADETQFESQLTAISDVQDLDAAASTLVDGALLLEQQSVVVEAAIKPRRGKKAKEPPLEPKFGDFKLRPENDWKIGVHVSTAGGVENAVNNAAELGANAFALFLKSNRKWESPPLSEGSISTFKSRMKELQYDPSLVLPHSTYLINMANPDKDKREKAYVCFIDDLRRCEQLGLTLCNFHPGSSVGQAPKEECIKNIADCLNRAHEEFPSVITVIECMAGTKNIIGASFQDLADIIDLVDNKSLVGVCLDTCHMFSAGYDLRTKEVYEKTMTDFENTIGLSYLKGFHFNDSKTPFNSGKDRHENIGIGSLGLASFQHILSDNRTKNMPLILETPGFDLVEVWSKEIEVLNTLSARVQAGEDVNEKGLVQQVKDAIKSVEKAGWGAKGKVKKDKPATTKRKRKKKDEESDEDEDEDEDDE